MFDWYYKVILNYTNFSGRARRQEYWYFTLVNVLVNLVMAIIDRVIGSLMQMDNFGFFGVIYALFIMIPSIAVTVRRLHDSGRSGWWLLSPLFQLSVFWCCCTS